MLILFKKYSQHFFVVVVVVGMYRFVTRGVGAGAGKKKMTAPETRQFYAFSFFFVFVCLQGVEKGHSDGGERLRQASALRL